MQNTGNMGNWTYPSDEKMKEIEDLLNNEMTFNLGIKMFSEEFSIFTYDSTISAGTNFYFKYLNMSESVVQKLIYTYDRRDKAADKLNLPQFKFGMSFSIRTNVFYIFL